MNKTIELHAQCLFTANYATVFNLKEGDRRYSVFQTGSKLIDNNFLGFRNYDALITQIDLEAEDFAKYLKSLVIDFKLLEKPFENPERARIIGLSKIYLQDFHDALVNFNINYFHKLRNRDLLHEIKRDFNWHSGPRINRAHLKFVWEDLFGEKLSADAIMDQLREITTEDIFEKKNIKKIGSKWYIYPRRKDGRYF